MGVPTREEFTQRYFSEIVTGKMFREMSASVDAEIVKEMADEEWRDDVFMCMVMKCVEKSKSAVVKNRSVWLFGKQHFPDFYDSFLSRIKNLH